MSFYRLNKDYLLSFQNSVFSRFTSNDTRSETGLLKAILKEINELFRKIGGQLSSKRNIPKAEEYPDSEKFNSLVQDISFDVDKLYNAQALVESDVVNLINFDAAMRDKSFNNLMSAQKTVYSAYVRSKKDLIGGVEVPVGNPFIFGDGTENIYHDADRESITLSPETTVVRNIDANNVAIYITGGNVEEAQYPLGDTFGVGSHWKKAKKDTHFIDQTSAEAVSSYKEMMIDDSNSNTGVGYTEFEIVRTIKSNGMLDDVKEEILRNLSLKRSQVYMDQVNSFQGAYMRELEAPSNASSPRYKLVIPFTSSVLTNELTIEFTAMPHRPRSLPSIDWPQSRVFSSIGGQDTAYKFVKSSETSQDGRFVCKFAEFLYPTRVELAIYYDGPAWGQIGFMIAHYGYFHTHNSYVLTSSAGSIGVSSSKLFNIFVDAEGNTDRERTRARNVLKQPNTQPN